MPDTEIDEIDAQQEGDSPQMADLRRRNRDLAKKAKRLDEVEEKLTKVERDRVLDSDTFKDLKPKQREALAKLHDGEFTAEALKATAVELGFVEDLEQQQIDDELDRQDRVTGAADSGATSRTTGAITPAQVAEWSAEKWVRFAADHPEAAEQLRMGQEVHGIAR